MYDLVRDKLILIAVISCVLKGYDFIKTIDDQSVI